MRAVIGAELLSNHVIVSGAETPSAETEGVTPDGSYCSQEMFVIAGAASC